MSLTTVYRSPLAGNLVNGLRRFAERSPLAGAKFTGFSLTGRTPTRLLGTPPELMPGDAATGQIILAGSLVAGGQRLPLTAMSEIPDQANEIWLAHLHGFSWLSHLRRIGTPQARRHARSLITGWIESGRQSDIVAKRPNVMGRRLESWLTHFGFLALDASPEFSSLIYPELAKEARHLAKKAVKGITGADRITALKGLIYCGVSLPVCDNYLHLGLRQLEAELAKQIQADGGHYSRNPLIHFNVLRELVAVRETFEAAHFDIPRWLEDVIERMVPILRAFRHADGGLALFNGARAGDPAEIDALLSKVGVKGRALSSAPHSGFHRLSAGRTQVIVDTGTPPSKDANEWAHAGTLSFEMSAGRDRIIVNCGMPEVTPLDWRQALRSTAAHSTIVVDDVNSSEINLDGGYLRNPGYVTSSRREIEGSTIIEASYNGYDKPFGLTHRRLIMLAPDGGEIQGEDNLIGSGGHRFSLRFHLHPNVQATVLQDKCSALLKPRRGKGWRFTSTDRSIALEESIYFDGNQPRRRTQQIVVFSPLTGTGETLKWRLSRI